MNIRLRIPKLRPLIDGLFPNPVDGDDAFVRPLSVQEIDAAREREIAAIQTLTRRHLATPLRLVKR